MQYAKDTSSARRSGAPKSSRPSRATKLTSSLRQSINEACRASIQFSINVKSIRFELPLPNRQDKTLTHYRRAPSEGTNYFHSIPAKTQVFLKDESGTLH